MKEYLNITRIAAVMLLSAGYGWAGGHYIPANSMSTPALIVPEWYFWPFYAILRSFTFNFFFIPAKLMGVLAMFGAFAAMLALTFGFAVLYLWPELKLGTIAALGILGGTSALLAGVLFAVAFLPASRSGTRDAAELEKLVGQQIRCRIIKLEAAEEDVVVDRRVLTEEEDRSTKERRFGELKEGDTVHGEVRSLTGYGAFVNIGGVDALLHIGDIAWSRINKPEDVLSVGQEIEARVLKVDAEKQRISVGMKQLLPHPWDGIAGKLKVGDRVNGVVTRVADFGAFVEIEPAEIHYSEIKIISPFHHTPRFIREALEAIRRGDILAHDFVTEEIRLNELPQAFKRMKSRSGEIKLAVRP